MAIFRRGTPNVKSKGYENIAIFDQYLAIYLRNDTRQSHGYYGREYETISKLSNGAIFNDLE